MVSSVTSFHHRGTETQRHRGTEGNPRKSLWIPRSKNFSQAAVWARRIGVLRRVHFGKSWSGNPPPPSIYWNHGVGAILQSNPRGTIGYG
jgi:hypothetical protein